MPKRHPNILDTLQEEIGAWAYEQFGKPKGKSMAEHMLLDTNDPLMGMVEELGELHHAVLKQKQSIRKGENLQAKEKDAIGDLLIYLLDYTYRKGFSASDILKQTWQEVKKRDWISNPQDGTTIVVNSMKDWSKQENTK